MSDKNVRWLHGELPELVAQGVLAPEAADRVRAHYGPPPPSGSRRWLVAIFSLLGAHLIGGGILLIVGHNWEAFSRPVRATISLALLLSAQAMCGWVLVKGKTGAAWREGAGTFGTLAVGACFALIAQTYHLSDDFGAFMLTWMLMSLPLAYFMNATVPAIIYMAGITAWAGHLQSWQVRGDTWGFWPLLALVLPYIVFQCRRDPYHPRAAWALWGLGLSLCFAVGICMEGSPDGLWMVAYTGYFGAFYLAGAFWQDSARSVWRRPMLFIGGAGLLVMALVQTFEDAWNSVPWRFDHIQDYLIAGTLTVLAVVMFAMSFRKGRPFQIALGLQPVLTAVAFGLNVAPLAMIAFNAYLLTVGILTLIEGVKSLRLGLVNLGMLAVLAVIVARFFDSDINMLARGIAFTVLGVAFLAANLWIVRRKGSAA